MVASHTEKPLGFSKWLVRGLPHNNIACPWVGDMVCVCPLPKGKVSGVGVAFPAISRCLKARLYGWLPLSNAYGISSIATQHKPNTNGTSFHRNTTQNQTSTDIPLPGGIITRHKKTQGVALGYMIVGLSGRCSTGML